MKIQDFSPSKLFVNLHNKPNPLITLVFTSKEDSTNFMQNFVYNSTLILKLIKQETEEYRFNFIFPKHNNYVLSIQPPITDNSIYEQLYDKTIEITCGFEDETGKILGISATYLIDNKISLN